MKTKSLNSSTVLLMAVSAAIVVANINYIQPIEADIAQQFNLANAVVGAVAMLTQLGYAFGLLLIVPMGDIMNRRTLIMRLLILAIVSALLAFIAPNIWLYAFASLLIGITSVAPQVIIPYAGYLAPAGQRGRVLGNVLSGLLVGVLLSRTVSGVLASFMPWQWVYLIAAVMIAGLWLVLWRKLPHDPVTTHQTTYREMIRTVPKLVKKYPVLRASAVNGFVLFGVSNIFWATLVFYLQHQYGWGSREAGLFALLGVTGVLAAPLIGRLADQFKPRTIIGVGLILSTLAYIVFGLFAAHVWGLVLGIVILDLGTQFGQVANQTRIQSIDAKASSRFNSVFMFGYFMGGALGSFFGNLFWGLAGWYGVCGLAIVVLVIGFYAHFIHYPHVVRHQATSLNR
ncbi:MFS transporter [Lactiplantibacillus sp. WILCCON 0030]|uniref:MFS transporter n=1 Tax=Lactiplantibacillus brownii TaxID=3069269 RepID=A0ABU1ABX6_9LACO|nr:MFS transporter [Lactiplantibacillus brownii]MDQ7938145.1 MFS transporter [Lactiplantibacillus brownii]